MELKDVFKSIRSNLHGYLSVDVARNEMQKCFAKKMREGKKIEINLERGHLRTFFFFSTFPSIPCRYFVQTLDASFSLLITIF